MGRQAAEFSQVSCVNTAALSSPHQKYPLKSSTPVLSLKSETIFEVACGAGKGCFISPTITFRLLNMLVGHLITQKCSDGRAKNDWFREISSFQEENWSFRFIDQSIQ